MQVVFRFICCNEYDFTDDNGRRIQGVSCKCFDENAKQIVKVKTDKMLDKVFGDEVLVNLVPNGRYLSYVVAE